MFVKPENIVAVSFSSDVKPTIIMLEEKDQDDPNHFSYPVYKMARTWRSPKQWFIDQDTNGNNPSRTQRTTLPFDCLYGQSSVPPTSLPDAPDYYWIKPGMEVIVEDTENEWQLRAFHQYSVRLSELPRSFSLTTLTKILGEAYDGLFYYCYECQDNESFESEEHSKHTSMWMSESDGRKGYFCPMCRKYRLTCRHGVAGALS